MFFFQTGIVFFPSVFKHHVVFQDKSKDYILCYVVFKEIHHRKYEDVHLNTNTHFAQARNNHSRLKTLVFVRGCLHVKFHPGMKLVPERNHPFLRWNVSYCLHVFAEIKFHPGMKKRRVNTSSRDEILKWAYFLKNFWRMYSNILSEVNVFEHNQSMNIMKHK